MPLTTKIKARIEADYSKQSDLAVASFPLRFDNILNLEDGAGDEQAAVVFSDRRSLADGASESLDLSGTLTDAFGDSVALTKVKAILIKASAANTTDLTIGGAASNAFAAMFGAATDKLVLKPGGLFLITAPGASGYAVTADTADLLDVANGAGAAAEYEVVIIGA